tara:strand:- start:7 stop:198 length:192 start_codon:yes stop_codon:yes gene_type:complete
MAFPDPISLVKVWHPNHIFGNVRIQSVKTAKTAIWKDSDVRFSNYRCGIQAGVGSTAKESRHQ